jgi:hypothetical protein
VTVVDLTDTGLGELALTPGPTTELVLQPAPSTELVLAPPSGEGPPGPPGPPGPAGVGYVHRQDTPAAEWRIEHDLGRNTVPVLVLDEDPTQPVYTDVTLLDPNTCLVTWPAPVSGYAYF